MELGGILSIQISGGTYEESKNTAGDWFVIGVVSHYGGGICKCG